MATLAGSEERENGLGPYVSGTNGNSGRATGAIVLRPSFAHTRHRVARNLEQRDEDDAFAWARAVNARWLVHSGLRENAADYLEHLAAVDPARLKRSCAVARRMVDRRDSASDPKPWFYAGLFSLATAEEGRRFLAGHEFTRAAIPELAEALGSRFTPDRVGEATYAVIERIRAALRDVVTGPESGESP